MTDETKWGGTHELAPPVEERVQTYDNMALNTFQQCQRKYEFFIKRHLVPESQGEALGFGIALHAGRERYRNLIMAGSTHDVAADAAIQSYEDAWNKEMPLWMTDPKKGGNRRGIKNGGRLLRGYLAKYGEWCKPVNIEVPFAAYVGDSTAGTPIIASGIIDEICEYEGQLYVLDLKTTTYEPDSKFFNKFRVSSAMMGYCVAVEETIGKPIAGAIIHAIWVRNIHSRSPRANIQLQDHYKADIITYTADQLLEWRQNIKATVDDIEIAEKRNYFRRNWGDACNNYNGCEYAKICGSDPSVRERIIENDFIVRVWDPTAPERMTKLDDTTPAVPEVSELASKTSD
jgi:hypothetical protein